MLNSFRFRSKRIMPNWR